MSPSDGPLHGARAAGSSAPRRAAGVAAAAAGVLCFSGTAPATRVAAPAFGAATLTFARIVIAATLAAATLAFGTAMSRPRRADLPALALMGIGLAIGFPLLLAIAEQRVPAAHAAVVIGVVPAATAALSVLRTDERPPARFWLGCAGGLVAVLVFAITQGGGTVRVADLWLLAAVLSCAAGYVEGGRLAQRVGGPAALCWAMILLAPVALVGLTIGVATRSVGHAGTGAWIGLVWAGVMSMFLGSIAWYHGLATGGIARIGQLNLLQPLLAITWSALFLHERITAAVPITATVVLPAMTVCVSTRGRPPVVTAPDRNEPRRVRPSPKRDSRSPSRNTTEGCSLPAPPGPRTYDEP